MGESQDYWRYLPLLVLLVQLVVGWIQWSLQKGFVGKKDCADCREKLEARVSKNEQALHGLPNNEALHELAISVTELAGDLRTMGERISGVDRSLERVENVIGRHEDYLLHNGK
jgi:uncharacterized coiled-coil protein SlyX